MSTTNHCGWLADTVYNTARNMFLGMISGFHREVDENYVLLGYYTVRSVTGRAITQKYYWLRNNPEVSLVAQ